MIPNLFLNRKASQPFPQQDGRPAIWSLPVLLLIICGIVRILFLDSRELALDEPFTAFWAQADFDSFFTMLKNENNPPLYYFILHYWIKIFGISAFSLRFLPFVFSTITVLFMYRIGEKFFTRFVGFLASMIFIFSNLNIYHAHENRVYSLFALLTTISMYAFLSLIEEPKSKKYFFLLTISSALMIWAHFLGFVIIALQLFSCVVIKELRKSILKRWAWSVFYVFLLFVPYLILFSQPENRANKFSGGSWVEPPALSALYTVLRNFSNQPVVFLIFLAFIVLAGIKVFKRNDPSVNESSIYSKIIISWFFFCYLSMFFGSFIFPVFIHRYLIFVSIGFYFLVAISVQFISKDVFNRTILGLFVLLPMILTFTPNPDHGRNMKGITDAVKNNKQRGTQVFICPNWTEMGFVYHYNLDFFKDFKHYRDKLNEDEIFPVNTLSQVDTNHLKSATNIIYLDGWDELTDPGQKIKGKIVSLFPVAKQMGTYKGYELVKYSKVKREPLVEESTVKSVQVFIIP